MCPRACPYGRTVSHGVRVSVPDVGRFRHCNRLRFPRRFRPRRRLCRARGGGRTANDRLLSFERTNVQVVAGPDALGQVFAVGRSRAHVFRFRVAETFPAHVACKKSIRRTAEAFWFSTENPFMYRSGYSPVRRPSPTDPLPSVTLFNARQRRLLAAFLKATISQNARR